MTSSLPQPCSIAFYWRRESLSWPAYLDRQTQRRLLPWRLNCAASLLSLSLSLSFVVSHWNYSLSSLMNAPLWFLLSWILLSLLSSLFSRHLLSSLVFSHFLFLDLVNGEADERSFEWKSRLLSSTSSERKYFLFDGNTNCWNFVVSNISVNFYVCAPYVKCQIFFEQLQRFERFIFQLK